MGYGYIESAPEVCKGLKTKTTGFRKSCFSKKKTTQKKEKNISITW